MALFGDALSEAVADAAKAAAELRAIEDRTPVEVEESRARARSAYGKRPPLPSTARLVDAEPLGLEGARDEALRTGGEILAGQASLIDDEAEELARDMGRCIGRSRSPRCSPASAPGSTWSLAIRRGTRSSSRSWILWPLIDRGSVNARGRA